MFRIRTTKTSTGNIAIQIVRYQKRKMIIVKHMGSAHNDKELHALKKTAALWIEKTNKQSSLFSDTELSSDHILKHIQYIGFRYTLIYESLYRLCKLFGFHWLRNQLLIDLVIARIIEPGSKLQSLEYLKEFIGIEHRREYFYRQIPKMLNARSTVESKVLSIAREKFAFECSLVFYDVTTLYFESSESDELRQCGFSKDNKFNQPQIVLGLLVASNGFPVGYQIFQGNKFEGHTLIPILLKFKRKYRIERFTVVADAAMISNENITALRSANLQYIVAARTANLSQKYITTISSQLKQHDGTTMRVETDLGDLVCEFSAKRFVKDKREMEKSITKAEILLKNPGTIKRVKFISSENRTYRLNTALIEKTKLLLGIKGYYTNLSNSEITDQAIIEHYHNLWQVEHAFRIAKSDLQIRPIFHFQEKMIETHVLICFMALAICKYMELKSGKSTKAILKLFKGVTDAVLVDKFNGEKFVLRSPMNLEVKDLLNKLDL